MSKNYSRSRYDKLTETMIILGLAIIVSFFLIEKYAYAMLICVSLVFIAATCGLVGVVQHMLEAIESRHWPAVRFSFVDGHIHNMKVRTPKRGTYTRYTLIYQLQYEYSGKKYICTNDETRRMRIGAFHNTKQAEEFLNRLRSGGLAYVCPQSPQVLFMRNGVSSYHFLGLIASLVILFISLLVWVSLVNDL